jgi:hypothetical protein
MSEKNIFVENVMNVLGIIIHKKNLNYQMMIVYVYCIVRKLIGLKILMVI